MEKKAEVLKLCQDTLGGAWKDQTVESVQLDVISGGLSNELFKCSIIDYGKGKEGRSAGKDPSEPTEVLVRYYGVQKHDHEAILKDSLVFALLSEKGLGPRLYGVFNQGRVEEYIPSRSLRTAELAEEDNMLETAGKMATLHKLKMPFCASAMLRVKMSEMYKAIQAMPPTSANKGSDQVWNYMKEKKLGQELDWFLTVAYSGDFPVRFCHNDVHEGNLLMPKARKGLILIDYEYANYNFRGYDFANHFLEWSICYDVAEDPYYAITPEMYPSHDQQKRFISAYLEAYGCPTESMEKEVDAILLETAVFTLAANMYWTLWSLQSVVTSDLKFGYMDYALDRINMYFESKAALLQKYPQNVEVALRECSNLPSSTPSTGTDTPPRAAATV